MVASEITRSDVMLWVKRWKKMSKVNRPPIEDYIRAEVEGLDLSDPMVLKAHYTEDPVMTHIADLIIDDLRSYGVTPDS